MQRPGEYNVVYHKYLVAFMSGLHGVSYEKKKEFSDEELLAAVPEDVLKWMQFSTFGSTDSDVINVTPAKIRSSTLEVMKKAIFWYMPNRLQIWNEQIKSGNPTRSREVNVFIKCVRKMEVRRVGKSSNARRPMSMAEFRKAIRIFERENNFENRYRFPTMIKYQYLR